MYSFRHDDITSPFARLSKTATTVVFVNGILDGGWMWEHVRGGPGDPWTRHRVATQPSLHTPPSATCPFLRQSISSIVDGLIRAPPVLCGTSLGALVAMELAASDPSRYSGSSSPEQSTSVPNSRRNGLSNASTAQSCCSAARSADQPGHQVAQRRRHVPGRSNFVEIPLCGISPMIEAPDLLYRPGAGSAGNRACRRRHSVSGTRTPIHPTKGTDHRATLPTYDDVVDWLINLKCRPRMDRDGQSAPRLRP